MPFRISGLNPAPFQPFFGLSEAELHKHHIQRYHVTEPNMCPDRIEMRDLDPGETALLLNYEHLPVDSPYRSRHAIYVREGAQSAVEAVGTVPEMMASRLLALRAIDQEGCIIDAEIAAGRAIEPIIATFFEEQNCRYIHAHFARRGCYAGLITRE